ncbi:hypothetical protein BC940DRAFT_303469 [Gongronella butleri]|nr:hypothetical protein BC940DRAFT_303469 [Gongronella butleri]
MSDAASPSTPAPQPPQEKDMLGPRGLSFKQQQEIATAQGQAASASQQRQYAGHTLTLYVGELDPNVEEPTLSDIFSSIAPVESIRLVRDAVTQKSLGYAYITFAREIEGDQAIQALNYTLIKGKPCRAMWMQHPPPVAYPDVNYMPPALLHHQHATHQHHQHLQSPPHHAPPPYAYQLPRPSRFSGNIFIKNLDPSVTTKSLLDTFSSFGQITQCKIVTDDRGQSKGYGFIHFDTMEAAERAINHAHGKRLCDRSLFVGHYIPRSERMQRFEEAKHRFTNVYVKNLVTDITEEELRDLFSGFGPILSVLIQRDDQNVSRGFGFVNFERHEDAERAVAQMHDTEYIGKRLFVSRAQKRSERDEELRRQHEQHPRPRYHQGVNLYIKNLSDDVDDDILRAQFSKFGHITSVKVMRDEKTLQSKGFGFVCFSTPAEAKRAVAEMNGKHVGKKTIYVALAQKKEERRPHTAEPSHPPPARPPFMQLQQPYVPVPFNTYNGPVYYDGYAGNFQPGMPPATLPPNMMAAAGRWTAPMLKQGGYLAYTTTTTAAGAPAGANSHAPGGASGAYSPIPQHLPPPGAFDNLYPPPTTSPVSEHPNTDPATDAVANDLAALTLDDIKDHSVDQQRQLLGEQVYNVVNEKHPSVAGKITGMLIEMEPEALVYLLQNRDQLDDKIQEAVDVLMEHQVEDAADA